MDPIQQMSKQQSVLQGSNVESLTVKLSNCFSYRSSSVVIPGGLGFFGCLQCQLTQALQANTSSHEVA